MKKLFLFALALCPAAAHVRAQTPPQPAAPKVVVTVQSALAVKVETVKVEPAKFIPDEIFDAELQDLDDGSFKLSEYRGRVFVLNFWASWCGPCRMEIPELNKLYEEYNARGVEFVGLTIERPGAASEKVREFARQFKMAYKLGWADPDVALALMSGTSIPQTLVVAPDGHIVVRYRGYSNKIPQLIRAGLEQALEPTPETEPPPAPDPPVAQAPPRPLKL